jgi:hypothetical protein
VQVVDKKALAFAVPELAKQNCVNTNAKSVNRFFIKPPTVVYSLKTF